MSRISAFPLLVLLFLLSSSAYLSVHGCPPSELKALLRFRSSLTDSYGALVSWTGGDCCVWDGVECSGARDGRHVSKLYLGGSGLRNLGEGIDSSLFELKHLSYLDLRSNDFHGEIPFQLGNLSLLRYLDLSSYRGDLRSSDLTWLSNLSSLEYLALRYVRVNDKSWGSTIGSLLHLKHLDLARCSLPPSNIPRTLVNLSSLTYLDLFDNNISGSLHRTIRDLSGLEYLSLGRNALTGEIPLSLGYNIKQYGSLSYLGLGWNNLEGTIPPSLGLLVNLTVLNLGANRLRGSIPANLGNLYNLKLLYLFNNQLSGSIPSFGHLSSLGLLQVSDNHLNGSIPSSMMLPSSLQNLDLSNNWMNGTVTEVFLKKCLKLEKLDLSHSGLSINISSTWIPSFQLSSLRLRKCQIGGQIPSWISTQFKLHKLDLAGTQLMGNLPSWLWNIGYLDLHNNHLRGSFTPSKTISPWSGSLITLDLSMNELSGHLPANIHVQLPEVKVLILSDNKFEGQIPNSIAHLSNLFFLDMYNNRLTGNVPATLSNLTSLQALNLANNCLEGEIPKELGRLSSLESLRIGKNSLHGMLPSALTNLSRLQVLDVGGNNLIGNIPRWVANFSSLHVLVMRSNNFSGNLLPEIGRMPELQVLDLSSNSFSGAIPHSYFSLPAMQNSSADGSPLYMSSGYSDGIELIVKGLEMHYEYVLSSLTFFDLSNNGLRGPLPPEVGNLTGLMYLNLSMNSLSGPIPHSLGILVELESMDLSFNNFTGPIPWEIGNLTYLARLNLSYNNLGGKIPQQGGQMLTFDNSSYIGNPDLWGCPLERNCSHHPVAGAPPPAVGVEDTEEDFEFVLYWMCFGLSVGVGFSGVVLVLMFQLSWRIKYFEVLDRIIGMLPKPKPKYVWR